MRVSEGRKTRLDCRRMALTDYESVPAVERAQRSPGLVVMKFGGTSVGDTERLKRVARRCVAASEAGNRVVAVASAMGATTDDLIRLAHEISDHPAPRELDMLASVGERISCALVAMAIIDLGHKATSLTGSQAGIVTDSTHTKARSSRCVRTGSTRRSIAARSCSSRASRVSPESRRT